MHPRALGTEGCVKDDHVCVCVVSAVLVSGADGGVVGDEFS